MDSKALLSEFLLRKLIASNNISTVKPLLLACSGGLDSVVLFHLMINQQIPFAVAHVNFKLRSAESDEDEMFVKALCESHKITCHITSFDTAKEATNRGISVQMAARELRYAWFKVLLKEHNYSCLATAHHADDNIETVLINIIRGTGLQGISGMPVFDGFIFRPLLGYSRSQVLEYAVQNNLLWREDSSNAQTEYLRNAIRKIIIPEFTRLNPSFFKVMHNNLSVWSEQSELVKKYCNQLLYRVITKEGNNETIFISKLTFHSQIKTLLHYWLFPKNFNANQIEQIIDSIHNTHETKIFLSSSHRLIKTSRELVLQEVNPELNDLIISKGSGVFRYNTYTIELDTINYNRNIHLDNKHYHFLDADMILYPLVMRIYRKGDYFYPFGLNKKKKLSDYYIDNKFSLIEKENTPLLCMQDKILAIIGHTIDHRFQVKSSTRKVLRILIRKAL